MSTKANNEGAVTVKAVSFTYAPLNIDSFSIGRPGLALSEAENAPVTWTEKYPLRGSVESYIDPTEPVGEDDWEALE